MKKVLVIGFLWPYHLHSAARLPGLLKFIGEFGWEPVLLTAPFPRPPDVNFKYVEVPYKDRLEFWARLLHINTGSSASGREQTLQRVGGARSLRGKIVNFAYTKGLEVVGYPDTEKNWIMPALAAAGRLRAASPFQAVITSSPPVSAHIIAQKLKDKYGVPWLADLPHLWSQDNAAAYRNFDGIRRGFDRRLELKTFRRVDALTTTSAPLAEKLRRLHGNVPVHAVTHGYDPATVNDPPAKLTEQFTITYTGGFAAGLRTPAMLLEALQNLIAGRVVDKNRVAVRFYGGTESWVQEEIQRRGLADAVKQYGRVPMAEAQARQRESQILFNPKWDDPAEPGIHSLKLLEYLAARRPVLATGLYPDVADDLIAETGAGVSLRDVSAVERYLTEVYREYRETGAVAWRGNPAATAAYSQREMAGKFAHLLDELVK